MKPKELQKKSSPELQKFLVENQEKLQQMRFGLSAGKVKNVRDIRHIKKEIARILTYLKQR